MSENLTSSSTSSEVLSPLRYPGGKRRFAQYIEQVLQLNGLNPKLFVEPFAGGLSVSLYLLQRGSVEKIGFGELDPMVSSFWKTVFEDSEWLKSEIRELEISLEKWKEYKKGRFRTDRERAIACLFLNRTSFSGILSDSAGPIGGYEQQSDYKIDCRFNTNAIVERIDTLSQLGDKVLFRVKGDWTKTVAKAKTYDFAKDEIFFYFDPPFYYKANKLYRYSFDNTQHEALRDHVLMEQHPWLLSYDAADKVVELYSKRVTPSKIGLLYTTATGNKRHVAEELVITNREKLPNLLRVTEART